MASATTTTVIAAMTELPGPVALIRLQTWLSPAFPVGSFSYSHGLELAVDSELVSDQTSLEDWLSALVRCGSAWNDVVLLAEAWRRARADGDLKELAELGEALAGSLERHAETTLQGAAFLVAITKSWPHPALERLPSSCAYPVAVGAAAGAHRLPLSAALTAFLQAFVSNLAQAAIRLGVTGQSGALAVIAALEGVVTATAIRAAGSTLADLGSVTILAEIMSMRHETHYSRLFRS